jgi:glucose-1-phosphate adenylyltransferase
VEENGDNKSIISKGRHMLSFKISNLLSSINLPPLFVDESAKVQQCLLSEGCEIYGTIEKSVVYSGVKIGKGARIKNTVILPNTIIEENAWIENAVIGSQTVVKNGVIIVSKDPNAHLMVVGNNVTVDPALHDIGSKNNVLTVSS